MNEASGTSDIEGESATGSGERGGSRPSFNKRTSEKSGNPDSADSVHSVENNGSTSHTLPNSRKVYVTGELHPDLRVPFREISLAPTKSSNGEIEINEP